MKKKQINLLGTVLVIMVLGLFFYLLFYYVKPSSSEVESQVKKVTPAKIEVLKTDLKAQTSGLEVNGQIPVTISKEELGRDDPFASY